MISTRQNNRAANKNQVNMISFAAMLGGQVQTKAIGFKYLTPENERMLDPVFILTSVLTSQCSIYLILKTYLHVTLPWVHQTFLLSSL